MFTREHLNTRSDRAMQYLYILNIINIQFHSLDLRSYQIRIYSNFGFNILQGGSMCFIEDKFNIFNKRTLLSK